MCSFTVVQRTSHGPPAPFSPTHTSQRFSPTHTSQRCNNIAAQHPLLLRLADEQVAALTTQNFIPARTGRGPLFANANRVTGQKPGQRGVAGLVDSRTR